MRVHMHIMLETRPASEGDHQCLVSMGQGLRDGGQ